MHWILNLTLENSSPLNVARLNIPLKLLDLFIRRQLRDSFLCFMQITLDIVEEMEP